MVRYQLPNLRWALALMVEAMLSAYASDLECLNTLWDSVLG